MNIFKNKAYLIALSLLILAVVVFGFLVNNYLKQQSVLPVENNTGDGDVTSTEYPNNLIEGVIIDIDSVTLDSFTIEADVSNIKLAAEEKNMDKIIKITGETKIITYNLTTKEEIPIGVDTLELGDNVVVATQESTREDILTRGEFTATRISKMIDEPASSDQ